MLGVTHPVKSFHTTKDTMPPPKSLQRGYHRRSCGVLPEAFRKWQARVRNVSFVLQKTLLKCLETKMGSKYISEGFWSLGLRTIRTQPRIRKRLLNRASGLQRKPSLCKVLVVVVLSYLPSGRSGWTLTEIVNSGPSHCWVYHCLSISSLDLSGGSQAIPKDLHHFTLSIILSFHFLFFGCNCGSTFGYPTISESLNEFERVWTSNHFPFTPKPSWTKYDIHPC